MGEGPGQFFKIDERSDDGSIVDPVNAQIFQPESPSSTKEGAFNGNRPLSKLRFCQFLGSFDPLLFILGRVIYEKLILPPPKQIKNRSK